VWIEDEIIIVRLLSRYESLLLEVKVGDRCSDCKKIVVVEIKSEYVEIDGWVIKSFKAISPGWVDIEVAKEQEEESITKIKSLNTIESQTVIIVKYNKWTTVFIVIEDKKCIEKINAVGLKISISTKL